MVIYERDFWADQTPSDEDGTTKFDLRGSVYAAVPETRERSITEDFTDLFNDALLSQSETFVRAVLTWARLRYAFFAILQDAGWNFWHLNQFEMDSMTCYYGRLADRLAQAKQGFITTERFEPTVLPPKAFHSWIN